MSRDRALGWLAAMAISASGLLLVPRAIVDRTPSPAEPLQSATPALESAAQHELDSAWLLAPLRPSRTPPAIRFAREPDAAPPPPEAPTRPPWSLRGIVAGPQPSAVFEGVAEVDGGIVVLAVGDGIADVIVEAIRGDTVFLRAGQDSWAVALEVPWG